EGGRLAGRGASPPGGGRQTGQALTLRCTPRYARRLTDRAPMVRVGPVGCHVAHVREYLAIRYTERLEGLPPVRLTLGREAVAPMEGSASWPSRSGQRSGMTSHTTWHGGMAAIVRLVE